jgi:hypothetical protein
MKCFLFGFFLQLVRNFDDLPVGGSILHGKTFEQMIEEQLRMDRLQLQVKMLQLFLH